MRSLRFAAIGLLLVGASLLGWRAFRTRLHAHLAPPSAQASVTQPANSQAPTPSLQVPSAATAKNEPANHLGPFSVAGRDYTVELQTRKVGLGSDREANTVVAMEIRDSAGEAQYQRTFPYIEPKNDEPKDEFVDSWSVSAALLSGTTGTGLLISYDAYSEPSAPEEEPVSWWQIFGVVGGKLVPFGAPLEVQGGLISAGPPSPVYKTAGPAGPQADVAEFKVWTGHCRLVFPIRVDWAQGKLTPTQQCLKTADGLSAGCQYKVVPEEHLSSNGLTFVRLWPNPDEKSGAPAKTVVKQDSKVALLTALVETKWSDGSDSNSSASGESQTAISGAGSVGIVQDSDLWMKVRIDGKEGWIHSEEDFQALGLPEDE
jgi:hypothetical protein